MHIIEEVLGLPHLTSCANEYNAYKVYVLFFS